MSYEEFIGQVENKASLGTQADAVKAVRATLETLAERIPADKIYDLAARLPMQIAAYLRPPLAVPDLFGLDEFFNRVSKREDIDLPLAMFHARVVIWVLQNAVTKRELDDIRDQLPGEFTPLFEAGPEGPVRKAA